MDEPSGVRERRESLSLSNLLLCHESCLEEDDEINKTERSELVYPMIGEEEDEDYVTELILKENQQFDTTKTIKTTSFDRLIAINWILTTRTRFGFQHQTAYIAISYFDLFLKRRIINRDEEPWAIRLLSVACLSLAAKIEERIVPGLSQYPQDQDFVFKSNVICKTELMILSTLDWKMNLITPFHYLNYFITKLFEEQNQSVSKDLVLLRSFEYLLDLIKEIRFSDYRQFIVAAATTMLVSSTSLDIRLTKDEMLNKFGSISWWNSNENDNVYSCYQEMKEIEERKHMTPPPQLAVSGDKQPVIASGSGSAKRRLSFNDSSDHTSPVKRMHKL